jgi:hypothetical protein
VGFNPYAKFRANATDYALVAVCVLVVIGLVAWAFFG